MPAPCGFNDPLDVGVLGGPLENLFCQTCIGDQLRWIAGAALAHDFRNLMPGDFAAGFNDLAHTRAAASAQINAQSFARLKSFESAKMRVPSIPSHWNRLWGNFENALQSIFVVMNAVSPHFVMICGSAQV